MRKLVVLLLLLTLAGGCSWFGGRHVPPPAPGGGGNGGTGPPTAAVPGRWPPLRALAAIDQDTVWAGGQGIILRSGDGGKTWEPSYSGTASVAALSFPDAAHGWALTDAGLLFTSDGGGEWQALADLAGAPVALQFLDEESGFALTTSGLFQTADGGHTWQQLPTEVTPNSICFGTPDDGWLTAGGRVLRSSDGGATWHIILGLTPEWTEVSLVCHGQAAWALFRGGAGLGQQQYIAFYTPDGGNEWQAPFSNQAELPEFPVGQRRIDSYVGPFAMPTDDAAFFVGLCPACDNAGGTGTVSVTAARDDGASAESFPVPLPPGAQPAALSFVDSQHGWLSGSVGERGFIVYTADGGRTWQAP